MTLRSPTLRDAPAAGASQVAATGKLALLTMPTTPPALLMDVPAEYCVL
jgi:hypothetical protein